MYTYFIWLRLQNILSRDILTEQELFNNSTKGMCALLSQYGCDDKNSQITQITLGNKSWN